MGAKGYSAGAIFLQVVPVFADVQKQIERKANDINRVLGDEMEKGGAQAGERAGKAAGESMQRETDKAARKLSGSFEREFHKSIDSINQDLGKINTSKLSNDMRRELATVKKEFASLKDVDLTVNVHREKAERDLEALKARLIAMRESAKIVFRTDIDRALADIAKIEAAKKAASKPIVIDIDTRRVSAFEKEFKRTVDKAANHLTGAMDPKIQQVKARLDELKDVKIGVDMSAERARAELKSLAVDIDRLRVDSPNIDVKVDAARAFAEIAALEAVLRKVDGKNIDINTGQAQRGLFSLARSGDDAANSFRSFNIVMLLVAGLGPALVPVLAAIAGGLLAIGPAAAAAAGGVAAALIGFSGLGTALQALNARQKAQGMTAQTAGKQNQQAGYAVKDALAGVADAERNAARAAEDAAQRVKDARQQAADAVRNALQQQADAQRTYARSVQDVQDAEQALRDARAAAAGTGHTLKDKIKDNALAITQAQLDSAAATNNYNAVMADGSSTNTEQIQAKLQRDQALQNLHELRDTQKELAKEKKKWDKEGVNGTDSVKSAQDQLTSAIQQQQDAYRNLQQSARAVDEARRKGAEAVKRALEDQNRTLADNARNIARADQALARARKGQGETFDKMSSQQNAVNAAFDALGPAGKKFALFLFHLQNRFQKWRQGIQAVMLPSIEQAIKGFIGSKSAGYLDQWITGMAKGFGQFVQALSKSFQGPAWTEFFKTMADVGPKLQRAYGHAFIKLMEAFASLLTVSAPFAVRFANGLSRMMDAFAKWSKGKDAASALNRFFDYMHKVGPRVLKTLGLLGAALLNLLIALAPYGDVVLGIVDSILGVIASMDPKTLGLIVSGLLAMVTASQLAYAAMNLLKAGSALATSGFGLFVFLLVGAALAVTALYKKNHALGIGLGILVGVIFGGIAAWTAYKKIQAGIIAVQRIMNASLLVTRARLIAMTVAEKAQAAMAKVAAAAQWLWNAAMEANPIGLVLIAITAVVAGLIWAYKHFQWFHDLVWKVINGVERAFFWLWDRLFGHSWVPDIVDGMKWAADMIGKICSAIGKIIEAVGHVFQWLWENIVRPVTTFMAKAFRSTFQVISWAWHHILWPVIKTYAKVWWTVWSTVIKVALVLMKALFKVVFTAIKLYWKLYLHPVFTAISVVLNWLWKNVVKPVLGWIGDYFKTVFTGMKWVWEHVLKPVFDYIGDHALPKLKGAFQTAVDGISKLWNGLKKVVGAPIKFVLDTIINKGLIAGFNKVASWVHMDGFDPIPIPKSLQSYATGGIMPGYTPGRDPHKFVSPTGGRLELSGGEAVMRPEWTRAVGPAYVNYMNRLAASGGVKAIRQAVQGFADGGVMSFAKGGFLNPDDKVYINGMAISRVAAAQTALAKQISGIPIYLMQGGFGGNHIAASGSSHNYPGVGDFGPGSVALEKVMRQVGFAAWARNVPGRSQVGSGAHVHAVSLLDPGDKSSPQVYGSWANHGNGLSGYGNDPAPHYAWVPNLMSRLASVGLGDLSAIVGNAAGGHRSIPGFIKDLVLHPVDTIGGWAKDTWGKASSFISDSPVFDFVKHVPENLIGGLEHKVWDIMPGWVKSTLGVAADLAGKAGDVVGDVVHGAGHVLGGIKDGVGGALDHIGLAKGGILPYNGTMMYDNGGYLPPGLTTVMNLTGKPEPVFTNDQWAQMGGGAGGGNIHYEPHFEGSNLTPEDVASDLNFTFRRIRRGGRYAGVGQ